MSAKSQYQTLYAYRWHITWRLIEAASNLSPAAYHQNPGYGHGSIHDLLFHLLRTDYSWRQGLEAGQQPPGLPAAAYPDLPSLRAGFEREQAAWEAYLGGLDEAAFDGEAVMTTRRGETWPIPRWRVLQHLALHAMQHHTELAQLLTAQGQSPGDIDFIFYN